MLVSLGPGLGHRDNQVNRSFSMGKPNKSDGGYITVTRQEIKESM